MCIIVFRVNQPIDFDSALLMRQIRQARSTGRTKTKFAELSAGFFDRKPLFFEKIGNAIAVLALNFDNIVFNGSACSAQLFEPLCHVFQLDCIKRNTGNNGNAFAFSAFNLAPDTHNTIGLGYCNGFLLFTDTLCNRTAALRAYASGTGRINYGGIIHTIFRTHKTE